jgi:hypothetical protein
MSEIPHHIAIWNATHFRTPEDLDTTIEGNSPASAKLMRGTSRFASIFVHSRFARGSTSLQIPAVFKESFNRA